MITLPTVLRRTAVILGVVWLGSDVPGGQPFSPDDPFFFRDRPSFGWNGQWVLKNQATPGLDARVESAWAAGWTGSGVVIGIVDDGVEIGHPDLAPNYSSLNSFDFASNDSNPSPAQTNDNHGTSVAGIVAARGGNGIGVTGVAPYATLAALRIDYDTSPHSHFVSAILHRSSGLTRTIAIKNHSYGISRPYQRDSGIDLHTSALATSSSAGTIHVFSAGNDRGFEASGSDPDANKKVYQSSPDVITVAAMGSDGTWSDYSNYGANVFVTAPSNSSKGLIGGITTDRTLSSGYNAGESFPDAAYTDFGGTSAAAPVVSGVLALAKEAQPALDGRFAKHLLALTSDVIDEFDATVAGGGDGISMGSAWKTNAAGYRFNMNYGYGLVDAGDMVTQAVRFSGVTPRRTHTTGQLWSPMTISNLQAVTKSVAVSIANPLPLEEVTITLSGEHTSMGDLSAVLTSPSGSVSRLMASNIFDKTDGLNWSYTTNAFWGEPANGTWTLTLTDATSEDSGIWNSWSMDLRMGSLVPAAGATTPALHWTNGSGTWNATGGTLWSGSSWSGDSRAVFSGTGGVVTVAAGGVTTRQGIRFDTSGYSLGGGTLTLGGVNAAANTITTVDGTSTIAASLAGKNAFRKEGPGTLVLNGVTSVSGALTVAEGQVRSRADIATNVVSNASFVFDLGGTSTYARTISGTGNIVKAGAGVLVLSGTMQHSGGTRVENGTLLLTSTAVLPTSGTVAVADDSILAVRTGNGFQALDLWYLHSNGKLGVQMAPAAVAGIDTTNGDAEIWFELSGSRGVAKFGPGTLRLTSDNTYTGPTIVAGGTLAVGNGGSASIAGRLVNNATVAFNHSNDARIPGPVSGTGALLKSGAGSLTLEGSGTGFSGPVSINGGSVVAAATAALGSGTLSVFGGAVHAASGVAITNSIMIGSQASAGRPFLAYWDFGSAAPTVVSGSGVAVSNVTQGFNIGTTAMLSSLNASTGYKLSSGTAASGGGNANLTARPGFNLSTSTSSHYSITLTASAGASVAVGNLQVGVRSLATGPRQFALRSSADGFQGSMGSALYSTSGTFNGAWQALNLSGTSSGIARTGTVEYRLYGYTGSGTPTSGVPNWQIDDLRISGTIFDPPPFATGTLGVASPGAHGRFDGQVVVFGTAVLSAAANSTATFAGTISGSMGSVVKAGPGVAVLAGSHTFAGATTISGGELRIDGSTAATSLVTVQGGAILGGSGTVGGSAMLASAATLSPGAGPGTLTLGGNLSWSAGSNYNWQMLSGTGSVGSGWDVVTVGGTLSITATPADPVRLNLWSLSSAAADGGGLAAGFDPLQSRSWRIATAGGLSGFSSDKFTIVTSATNGTQGFKNSLGTGGFSLAQTGNAIDLVFTAGVAPSLIEIAVNAGIQSQSQAGHPVLSGTLPFHKSGSGTLVLDQPNSLRGPTTVRAGGLELAHSAALASSIVSPLVGGTVSVAAAVQTAVAGLDLSGGGLVDVGTGAMSVSSGLSATDLVPAIMTGFGDGSWNGVSGITSSSAAASGGARTVGWLDSGDGSVTFAYAAAGDTNLDWVVDILDVSNIVASGKFGAGPSATWVDGDFNYDGVVDIQDVADFSATGLYGGSSYNTASGVAAVPEPAPAAILISGVIMAASARTFRRRA